LQWRHSISQFVPDRLPDKLFQAFRLMRRQDAGDHILGALPAGLPCKQCLGFPMPWVVHIKG
jgi:hypothetical protein